MYYNACYYTTNVIPMGLLETITGFAIIGWQRVKGGEGVSNCTPWHSLKYLTRCDQGVDPRQWKAWA